jgi:DNA-binding response OmpR family regulator
MTASAATLEVRAWRILIVEDEPTLAYVLEETLIDAGFAIAGVADRLEAALAIVETDACDAAILDTNLSGVSAAPIAQALAFLGVPFLVLTGYAPNQLPGAFAGALHVQKPCRPERLIEALRGILPDGLMASPARG